MLFTPFAGKIGRSDPRMLENPFEALDLGRIAERHKLEDVAISMCAEYLNKALGLAAAIDFEGGGPELRAVIRSALRMVLDATERRDRSGMPPRPKGGT